jgi:hypothetical protein
MYEFGLFIASGWDGRNPPGMMRAVSGIITWKGWNTGNEV